MVSAIIVVGSVSTYSFPAQSSTHECLGFQFNPKLIYANVVWFSQTSAHWRRALAVVTLAIQRGNPYFTT